MLTIDLEKICCLCCKAVTETAAYIKSNIGTVQENQIEFKSFNSLVSHIDKTAENLLKTELLKILPNSGFIAEESEAENIENDYVWIIDPLDGTTNFLHQLPFFAISVGLRYKDEIVVGIVYDIVHEELFYAWKNGGAYMNGTSIKVSDRPSLDQCLAATGFPYYNFDWMEAYLRCFRYFMHNTRGVRRIGSAALDLAYVACGRFDFYFEYSLQSWDMAGGILLVSEAGGMVTDIKGGKEELTNGSVIASNPHVFQAVLEIIQPEFRLYC